MKQHFGKFAMSAAAVMVFSALTGYVYAAHTTPHEFTFNASSGTYTSVAERPRGKTNSSAMFLTIDSGSVGSSYNVRAMGCPNYDNTVNYVNFTLYNNAPVDHVVCSDTKYYGIKNEIRENKYYFSILTVAHNGGYGTVSGEWAPETAQTYATPSAP